VSPFRLKASDVQEYCVFLKQGRNHAPATVNRRLQALRKFYHLAVEQGWAESNPADQVSLLTETVSQRSRFLTPDDVRRLLGAVQSGRRRWVTRDWAIMQAFLGAGLKLSELTQLLLADVHLDAPEPCLDVRDTAGLPDRTVPLDAEVSEALGNYLVTRRALAGVQHLFVNRDGRPLSTRSVQRLLRHYARAAQLSDLTTQALRYLYARRAYETCQDPETVARLLGHRHLATTIRYLRPGLVSRETSPAGDPEKPL
jgi:integrase/recombinase XerC